WLVLLSLQPLDCVNLLSVILSQLARKTSLLILPLSSGFCLLTSSPIGQDRIPFLSDRAGGENHAPARRHRASCQGAGNDRWSTAIG
ncbi:MAG: hypothetical protein WC952_09760, partial [Desulfobulbaceae bacterium]